MRERIEEYLYNRYRAYLRRQREPVREIYGDGALPAALKPLRGTLVRYGTAPLVVAAVVSGCALWGGVFIWEDHQQEARAEAEFWEASDKYWALRDAYDEVREDEMRERGISQGEIVRAEAAAFLEDVGGEERGPNLPEPRDPDTLEIRDQLDQAEARSAALSEQIDLDS